MIITFLFPPIQVPIFLYLSDYCIHIFIMSILIKHQYILTSSIIVNKLNAHFRFSVKEDKENCFYDPITPTNKYARDYYLKLKSIKKGNALVSI